MHLQSVHGFSFIEILISLLLLSVLLLLFEAEGPLLLLEARSTYYRHIATNEMIGLAERLRALNQYGGLSEQIDAWSREIKDTLSQGEGSVYGSYPHYQAIIRWGKEKNCLQTTWGPDGCLKKEINIVAVSH